MEKCDLFCPEKSGTHTQKYCLFLGKRNGVPIVNL